MNPHVEGLRPYSQGSSLKFNLYSNVPLTPVGVKMDIKQIIII